RIRNGWLCSKMATPGLCGAVGEIKLEFNQQAHYRVCRSVYRILHWFQPAFLMTNGKENFKKRTIGIRSLYSQTKKPKNC
ncbi:MAG: hypothetical protein P8J27_14790, partial [Mariniblastus sp.]|nr:hypothetical protein [Mariniblastus sp.]